MRNLLQFPLTDDEIVHELEQIQAETINRYEESMICGDLRGVIIAALIERIKEKV